MTNGLGIGRIYSFLTDKLNMDDLVWPVDFMDIGLKTFRWVFVHRKEWVSFTMNEMNKPTGLFKKWKHYCKEQIKFENENK